MASHASLPSPPATQRLIFFQIPDQHGEPATTAHESGGHSSELLPFSTVKQEDPPPSSLLLGRPYVSCNSSAHPCCLVPSYRVHPWRKIRPVFPSLQVAAGSFPSVHQCVLRGEQSSLRKRCHGAWTAGFEVSGSAEPGSVHHTQHTAGHTLGVRGSGSDGQSLWGPHTVQELLLNWKNSYQQNSFPGGPLVKNLPASAGDTGSIPSLGSSHMLRSN